MEDITALREAIVGCLAGDERFRGCRVMGEYPMARREFPVAKPVIAVGFDSVETKGSLGGFVGYGEERDLYGTPCTVTVRFDIFVPPVGDSSAAGNPPGAHRLLELLWDKLLLSENGFGFVSFAAGPIGWDKATETNRMTVKGTLCAAMTRGDASAVAESFRVVRTADETEGKEVRA